MPKTFRHLYPQIYDFENLYQAYRKARKGGKRKKVDFRPRSNKTLTFS